MTLQVALPVPLPRAFDYLPPAGACPGLEWVGRRVRVPFGSGERVGLVVGVGPPTEAGIALRPILALLDDAPLLGDELLSTLRFCASYYHAPLGEVLGMALPVGLRDGQALPQTQPFSWRLTEAGATALGGLRPGAPRRLAERLLGAVQPETVLEDGDPGPGWRAAARKLAARGLAERIPIQGRYFAGTDDPHAPEPTPAQQSALDALRANAGFHPFLLEGITGSGKTEVYLQAIRDCLRAGRRLASKAWLQRLTAFAPTWLPGIADRAKADGPALAAPAARALPTPPPRALPISEDAEQILSRCPIVEPARTREGAR